MLSNVHNGSTCFHDLSCSNNGSLARSGPFIAQAYTKHGEPTALEGARPQISRTRSSMSLKVNDIKTGQTYSLMKVACRQTEFSMSGVWAFALATWQRVLWELTTRTYSISLTPFSLTSLIILLL